MKFGTFLFFFFFVVYSFSAKGRIPKNRPNRRIQEEIIKGKSSRMNEVNIIKGIALPKQKSKINKNVQKIREIYLSEKTFSSLFYHQVALFCRCFCYEKWFQSFFYFHFSVHYALSPAAALPTWIETSN